MNKNKLRDMALKGPEKDELLLQAYFDGELSGAQSEAVHRRAAAGDPDVLSAREEFTYLRSALREFVALEHNEGERRLGGISLWEGIESELGALPPKKRKFVLGDRLKELSDHWGQYAAGRSESFAWLRPSAFGVAFAAAALLYYSGSGKISPAPSSTTVSLVTDSEVVSEQGGLQGRQSAIPVVALTGTNSGDTYSGFVGTVPLAGSKTQRTPFIRDVPLRVGMDSGQLIGDNPVSGGLRTDGLDIEWIKTNRPFKILPSTNRKAPPVIWVARGTR